MSNHKKLLEAIQKYPENELSKKGIIPLLQKMGYDKVEFFGGQNEDGKDIVLWEKDKWGEPVLRVAQVKHFKLTNTASDTKSLQTVINQLTACFIKSLPYTDKIFRRPVEVLLISTHAVDSKSLLTRFDKEITLKDQNIKIIDGAELASKFIEYLPEFVKEIAGLQYEFDSKLSHKFSNDILLRALGKTTVKDIKAIYSDIDFSLGKITTDIFFNSIFSAKKVKIEISVVEWEFFKNLCMDLSAEFELDFIEGGLTFLESRFAAMISHHKAIAILIKGLELEIETKKTSINSLIHTRNIQSKIVSELKERKQHIRIRQKDELNTRNDKEHESKIFSKLDYSDISNKVRQAENELAIIKKSIDQTEKRILQCEKDKIGREAMQDSLVLALTIDGTKLASQIISKRNWIEENVSKLNNSNPTSETLKSFIKKCDSILILSSKIFDPASMKFFGCLGFNKERVYRVNYETTRFRLPIEHIFDTGLNISVLGDAGAGKSTSLEMYAFNRKKSDKTIILIPLGYIVQRSDIVEKSSSDNHLNLILEQMIVNYLNTLGLIVSLPEFQALLKNGKVVLLLDGLDEAIKLSPFLPNEISQMSQIYKTTQFIVTSRMHGSYINSIPFFSVTLLPFTNEQRDEFISKWFENEIESKMKLKKIKLHLERNRAINDIIRNPLLSTTLCVLAQYNISLPKSEIRLYDERLRLFTGYYDNVKHISLRIESIPSNLEMLAQKLAFYLHKENKREEHLDILKAKAKNSLQSKLDANEIELAFKELMYPCEILVPMSPDGKYGFGHLRFQEHLAARELMNRNINIIPLLSQDWWKSTLKLFVQMNDNIQWLITEIDQYGKINLPIVKELVDSRHKIERDMLNQLIKDYILLKTDGVSSNFFSFDNLED